MAATIQTITSVTNATVKDHVKLQRSATYRRQQGRVVLDASLALDELIQHHDDRIESLWFSSDQHPLYSDAVSMKISVYLVTDAILNKLTDVKSNAGYCAVIRTPDPCLDAIQTSEHIMMMGHCQNPSNVGAITRSLAAFDWPCVSWPTSVDVSHPGAIRAMAGQWWTTPWVHATSADILRYHPKMAVYELTPNAAATIDTIDWQQPALIMIGSEAGAMPESLDTQPVSIPMMTGVDSLNVSIAASIVAYQRYTSVKNI